MAVIEPQFQRDFISLLPKELALSRRFGIFSHQQGRGCWKYDAAVPSARWGSLLLRCSVWNFLSSAGTRMLEVRRCCAVGSLGIVVVALQRLAVTCTLSPTDLRKS